MKDWSVEEAQAAQRAYRAAGGDKNSPAGPIFQWAALRQIDEWQAAYEAGKTFYLLHAVSECARCELIMPEWVVRGFLDRIRSVTQGKVRTLDEAFGAFFPKGAKLPAYRQMRQKGILAYYEVEDRHRAGKPIDTALFESVGESLGIGGSKVRDYYYAWKRSSIYK